MRFIADISIEEVGTVCNRFFDYDDGDFAMRILDNMAMDSDGDLMLRMGCLLYTSPSPRDLSTSRMPSSA